MPRLLRTLVAVCAVLLGLSAVGWAQDAPPEIRVVDQFPGVGFQRAVFVTEIPGSPGRFLVVEQGGRIYAVERSGVDQPWGKEVVLDLRSRVSRDANEEGLFALALHPGYPTDPRMFVHYSAAYSNSADRKNILASVELDASDPTRFDIATLSEVLTVPQPFSNHNGGMIAFGPDGMLYVALGDGGSGGDPLGHGQNLGSLLGTILRLDIDDADRFVPGTGYAIPADNPFVARPGARAEIWAYGLRNPWRFSFDRATGLMWAGDVGQSAFEEIDVVEAGGNYGWNRREGLVAFDTVPGAPADPLRDPVAVYGRSLGQSVTGGYVYRGSAIPGLVGTYVYGDFASGRLFGARTKSGVTGAPQGPADVDVFDLLATGQTIASFGETAAGELLFCTFASKILRIEAADVLPPDPEEPLPEKLSALRLFESIPRLRPISGAISYDVNSPLWSDGAAKRRFLVLPPATAIEYAAEDALGLPVGAIAVKSFLLRTASGRLSAIETRVIRKTTDGFDAATYVHDPDGADATRLDVRDETTLGRKHRGRPWTFPSPADCRSCHTSASGFLLGVTAEQMRYPGRLARRRDPLADLAAEGTVTGAPPDLAERPRLVPLNARAPVETRARAYLASNCAGCHRPGGAEDAGLDLRFTTDLAATGLIDALPQRGDLDIDGARVVAPGDPRRSLLIERLRRLGEERMPPIGSHRLDRRAIRLLTRWVRRLR